MEVGINIWFEGHASSGSEVLVRRNGMRQRSGGDKGGIFFVSMLNCVTIPFPFQSFNGQHKITPARQ
jgi:hypothetical protein